MRIAAIVFIILAVVANFIVDNLTVFVLAMFSFPVLLWVLLKKKKTSATKVSADSLEKIDYSQTTESD